MCSGRLRQPQGAHQAAHAAPTEGIDPDTSTCVADRIAVPGLGHAPCLLLAAEAVPVRLPAWLQVQPTDYIVHTRGYAPANYSTCDIQPGKVSYVEAQVGRPLWRGLAGGPPGRRQSAGMRRSRRRCAPGRLHGTGSLCAGGVPCVARMEAGSAWAALQAGLREWGWRWQGLVVLLEMSGGISADACLPSASVNTSPAFPASRYLWRRLPTARRSRSTCGPCLVMHPAELAVCWRLRWQVAAEQQANRHRAHIWATQMPRAHLACGKRFFAILLCSG